MSYYSGLRRLVLFSLATVFLSCQPDIIGVARNFYNNGNVRYLFTTINSDGVRVDANGRKFEGEEVFIPIVEGVNSIEATAYNQWGEDKTPSEDSFYSPNEEEAREIMEGVFAGRGYQFLEKGESLVDKSFRGDVRFSFGAEDDFIFDYWGRGLRDFVINYVGPEDDREKTIRAQSILNEYGFPNLFLYGFPEEEIKSRLETFLTQNEN